MNTLLRSARLGRNAAPYDVLVSAGRVARVRESITAEPGWEVVDLDGRFVLPGLWDHHVHFDQWTLARERVDLSGAESAAATARLVAERLRTRPPEGELPLVGYGFRDAMWADRPHRDLLDAAAPDVAHIPVVLISGDLHSCWLNSAAARRYGWAEHASGVLRESEWQPILADVNRLPPEVLDAWAAKSAAAAAARGVVGVVELEAPWQLDAWIRRVRGGNRALRVACGVWPSHLEEAIERGLRSGEVIHGTDGLVEMGPFKVITDGSLNTRTAYCHDPYPGLEGDAHPHGMLLVPPEELVPLMERAWRAGLRPAVHAIGDRANSLALDAFERVGARGTIEHAQLLDEADLGRFAALGVVASVQPEHAMDDRDVADHHWAGRTGRGPSPSARCLRPAPGWCWAPTPRWLRWTRGSRSPPPSTAAVTAASPGILSTRSRSPKRSRPPPVTGGRTWPKATRPTWWSPTTTHTRAGPCGRCRSPPRCSRAGGPGARTDHGGC
ncbi:amidohydrolase [Nonomuraea dietziae]|uniref:amidohydrolase n=1 Tax=Nonomuraea dietziae TaxID=65515 RepID=UPI0031D3C2D7